MYIAFLRVARTKVLLKSTSLLAQPGLMLMHSSIPANKVAWVKLVLPIIVGLGRFIMFNGKRNNGCCDVINRINETRPAALAHMTDRDKSQKFVLPIKKINPQVWLIVSLLIVNKVMVKSFWIPIGVALCTVDQEMTGVHLSK